MLDDADIPARQDSSPDTLRYFPAALAEEIRTEIRSTSIPAMQTPRTADFAITGQCNLKCKTCYYADEMVALSNMPLEKLIQAIDELGAMNVMTVTLTGGEPMMHKGIYQIIEAVVRNRMRFSMNSNGMLFNPENAKFIKDTNRCNGIQISIDGSCPEVHDQIRGKGSFKKAVRGIKVLQEAGVNVSIRVTINRLNVEDLPAIFHLLYNELGLKNVGTNEAFPRGAAHCNLEDLDMSPEQRRLAEKLCMEAAEKYPNMSATAGPLVIGKKLKEIKVEINNPNAKHAATEAHLSSCGVASNKIAIMHDGAVVPCHQLPDMVLGYVGETPLKTIWHESMGLQYLRSRHQIPLEHLETCKGCKYQKFCRGGCPATAYAATGKITSRDPRSCFRALLGEDQQHVY